MIHNRIDAALQFEGMTTRAGLTIMDMFLNEAVHRHPIGSFVEFGTYKGRTAALLAQHINASRWLHAVEQSDYLEFDRLKQISERVTWHRMESEAFCAEMLQDIQPVIVSHHDASHFFNNVYVELKSIAQIVHPSGVIILDDFNDTYSQVRAAYYFLRYAKAFPYEILLIGFNKCILVHNNAFDDYESFILDVFIDRLRDYELDCKLARTDVHEKSKGFSVVKKTSPQEDDRYGMNFLGDRYYKPSSSGIKKLPELDR